VTRSWRLFAATALLAASLPLLDGGAAGAQTTGAGDHVLLAAGDVAKCDSAGDEATAALVGPRRERCSTPAATPAEPSEQTLWNLAAGGRSVRGVSPYAE